MRDFGKLIAAKGFEKLPKVQKSPNLETLDMVYYIICSHPVGTFLFRRLSISLLHTSLYSAISSWFQSLCAAIGKGAESMLIKGYFHVLQVTGLPANMNIQVALMMAPNLSQI